MLAVAAATGITAAEISAGTYTANLSGAIVNQTYEIFGVPGIPPGAFPPDLQSPKLVPFGGPGWAAKLSLSINSNTGAPTEFIVETTAGYIRGGGGPQAVLHAPGQRWTTGTDFPTTECSVTSANPGETGTIVYTCPLPSPFVLLPEISRAESPGYQCLTVLPSSTNFSGGNGCGNANSGITFPGGIPNFGSPQVSDGAHIAIEANSGISISGPANNAYYASNDPTQIFNGVAVINHYTTTQGADFTIKHSGSFSGNDFVVTEVEFINRTIANFPCGACMPQWLETAEYSVFDQLQSQTFQLSSEELGKAVPATGIVGIFAMLLGLIGAGISILKSSTGYRPTEEKTRAL